MVGMLVKFTECLIKPVSSRCNLKCEYCFYLDISKGRKVESYGLMGLETLEQLVRKVFKNTDEVAAFAFQGGEPLLAGTDFYEKFIELEEKYNKRNIRVMRSIQTNGLLIDESYGKFFKKNKFLIGVSLDGFREVHDKYRLDNNLEPTFDKVMKGIDILRKYDVEFNILTVITKEVARNIKDIYRFYVDNKFNYLQFIPAMDMGFIQRGKDMYSLTNNSYYKFLKDLFNLWYRDFIGGRYISIQNFDDIINKILRHEHMLSCFQRGVCKCQNVVEANGNLYPCDFYCSDQYILGNILDDSIDEMMHRKTTEAFIEESIGIPKECRQCEYYRLCRNGCKRFRVDNRYYYCEATKKFFAKNIFKFEKITKKILTISVSEGGN